MGLDNGICVKRTARTAAIPELRSFEPDWIREYEEDYEVCYWRKCWNIRSLILDVVDGCFSEGRRIALSAEVIDRIIGILESLDAENWEDEGGSIWEFSEMEERLRQQIENLGVLKRLMQEHELEVYFYDSY